MSNNPEDDDGLFDENNEDDSSDEEVVAAKKPTKKRKSSFTGGEKKKAKPQSWIDDAAEESGDEGSGDDDDDDDDENENDYIKDDFVVGEDEVEFKKKKSSRDLEDSDDDDGDDDDDDDDEKRRLTKKKRVKKKKTNLELAEEDLDLIAEARGDTEREAIRREREEAARKTVFGRDQDELHKGLFNDSDEDDDAAATATLKQAPQRRMVEQYDEDGMDDFIDDDLNDQQQIMSSARREAYDEEGAGVSEAQLNEASEIFGTDYLEFMATDDQNMDDEDDITGKYSERGVGVDLLDSEESSEDDDDDLFGDDDGGDTVKASQKREALKLKREKRDLARQERRKAKLHQKSAKRKAQLRRAFEPVQLMENFCTDKDDEIRRMDAPERFFEWKTPFHGSTEGGEITEEEEEEAMWIIGRIPEIASEYFSPSENMEEMEKREEKIMSSVIHALRLLHVEKLEPIFIKRYREDVVTSPAVRKNLYKVMDEDAEYDTMVSARTKVGAVLENIMRDVETDEATGAEADFVQKLESDLRQADQKLEEAATQESDIKTEIEQVSAKDDNAMDDDDDDDELFGDDDEDVSFMFLPTI